MSLDSFRDILAPLFGFRSSGGRQPDEAHQPSLDVGLDELPVKTWLTPCQAGRSAPDGGADHRRTLRYCVVCACLDTVVVLFFGSSNLARSEDACGGQSVAFATCGFWLTHKKPRALSLNFLFIAHTTGVHAGEFCLFKNAAGDDSPGPGRGRAAQPGRQSC